MKQPKLITRILKAPLLYIIIAFGISIPISATLLRQNNLKMIELRDEVIKIDDETGDIEQIEPALLELREYVLTHMNATLPNALELPGSYNKAVEKARKDAEKSGSANASIYRKAQDRCEDPNIPLTARAQCVQDYVLNNVPPGSDAQGIQFPPKEQFTYNFISPTWSFDLAGISVAVSVILGLAIITQLFSKLVVKKIIKSIDDDPLE